MVGGIAGGALVVVAVVVVAALVFPGSGDGTKRTVSARPSRSQTPTVSHSATPTAIRTGHDSHTRYKAPHKMCKKADFSAFRSMGLTEHPTNQSNTGGKAPIEECAYGWSTSSMLGSVTVEGTFERSTSDADSTYDMDRQDITADKKEHDGHVSDGAEIGRKSFRYTQRPLGPDAAFLDLGTADGTMVLVVGIYVHADDGTVTEKDDADMYRRMHRVAVDTLRSLRK